MSKYEYGSQEHVDAMAREVLPIPVIQPGTWQAKAIKYRWPAGAWPLLQVLFPYHEVGIREGRDIIVPVPVPYAERPLDSYSQQWTRVPYDEKGIGIQVGYWPDDGDPLVLVLAGRSAKNIMMPSYNIPPQPGEVRLRVVNFLDRQWGGKDKEKRFNGQWSEGIRIERVFEYDDAELAWSGKEPAWYDDDEKDYIEHAHGENKVFRPTPPAQHPYIPIEHSGRMDREEMYMPRRMTQAEAAGTDAVPTETKVPETGHAPVAAREVETQEAQTPEPEPHADLIAECDAHVQAFAARGHSAADRWRRVIGRLKGEDAARDVTDAALAEWLSLSQRHGWTDGEQTLPKVIAALGA